MSRVRIFVEGIADICFLTDYIEHCVPIGQRRAFDFIDMKGKDGLLQYPVNESDPFTANTDLGGAIQNFAWPSHRLLLGLVSWNSSR